MQNPLKSLLSAVLLITLTGCTARLVDFTILSTKNVDLSRAGTFERGKTRVTGKDEISIIIFIPTGVPNVKEAIDRAIESVPGAVALLDGVLTYEYFYIPYIFGQETYIVEGTPLIDPSLAANTLPSPFMIAKLTKEGKVQELKYVSKDEYTKLHKKLFSKTTQVN